MVIGILTHQSHISKVFSRFPHSPGSHQQSLYLYPHPLTDSLTDSLTSWASCGAKNEQLSYEGILFAVNNNNTTSPLEKTCVDDKGKKHTVSIKQL